MEKRYAPVFKCKHCGKSMIAENLCFTAEGTSDIRMCLNVKCKPDAPLHPCKDGVYGMTELEAAFCIGDAE